MRIVINKWYVTRGYRWGIIKLRTDFEYDYKRIDGWGWGVGTYSTFDTNKWGEKFEQTKNSLSINI
jgi:hypothetical protein